MASTVPPEIIMTIFETTNPRRGPEDLAVNTCLPKIALLNKAYLHYARRELYSDVYLSVADQETCEDTVRSFLQTVRTSPHLAFRVRGIHYGGSKTVTEDETQDLAEAILCCDNLLRLRVFGYDWFAVREIGKVITTRPYLAALEISTFTLANQYTSIFSMLSTFFSMLQSLGNIRSVIVHPQTMGWDRNQSLFNPSDTKPGSCAKLDRFIYGCGDYWDNRHIVALSQIAPSLSVLELSGTLTSLTNLGLHDALEAWSNLAELTLLFPTSEKAENSHASFGIDDVVARMPSLRVLRLSSSYVLPATFARGPASLERLEYKLLDGQLRDFIITLRHAGTLPNLRVLGVWRFTGDGGRSGLSGEGWSALAELCENRQITLLP